MNEDKYIKPYSTNYNLKPYEQSVRTIIFPWIAIVKNVITSDEDNRVSFECDYYTYGNIQHPQNLKLFGDVSLDVMLQNAGNSVGEIEKYTIFIIESHVAQNSTYEGNSFWRYYFFNAKDIIISVDGNTYYKIMLQHKMIEALKPQVEENQPIGIEHVLGLNKL